MITQRQVSLIITITTILIVIFDYYNDINIYLVFGVLLGWLLKEIILWTLDKSEG